MKIVHVNFSGHGGAAIAMVRLHKALLKAGVDSEVWCARDIEGIPNARLLKGMWGRRWDGLKNVLVQKLAAKLGGGSGCSYNIFPSRLVRHLNASDADVVHLHWINAEMVRLEQLKRLRKPIVWTFHDMWPFSGAEHYTADERYVAGYDKESYSPVATSHQLGVDLDRWVFRRKQKHWKNLHVHVVCLSRWMADCVRQSELCGNAPLSQLPNCLDTDVFKPLECRDVVRTRYGIPLDKKVILFGAIDPSDHRKGGDLMDAALDKLENKEGYCLVVFGGDEVACSHGIQSVAVGKIHGDEALARLYNCADVVCVPSRQESFGQTASEPLACGVPVVAFNATGLKDIVDHRGNGYLANPYDPADFAQGISRTLDQEAGALSQNARNKAVNTYAESLVAKGYMEVYKQMILG